MTFSQQIYRVFAVSLLLILTGTCAVAQTSRGTVTGIVTDPTGAAIANADLLLRNDATKTERTTKTNDSGLYRFDAVDSGTYSMSVKQAGFSSASRRDLVASAGQILSVDVKLEVGDVATTIEVSSSSEALQTEAAARGGTIATALITEIPLSGRDPASLALTLPGVSSNRFGFGVGTFVVNGARGRSNNFLIDGVDNNDTGVAGQAFVFRMVDAVAEVNVQTANFDAEFGRAGGAVVNTITKSGTNEFHGTAHYMIDSTFDDATTNTLAQTDPEVIRRGRLRPGTEQWYGATFGGPIVKNRTFFFGGFQDRRQNSQSTQPVNIPSADGFATLQRLFPAGASKNLDLYRQILGDLRATGQFTSLDLGGGRGPIQVGLTNYGYAQTLLDRQWLVRVDHQFSEKDQISGRYINGGNDTSPSTANYPRILTTQQQQLRSAQIAWTHIFSPTVTNEFRPAYTRSVFLFPNDAENELARTLARYTIGGGITSLGVATNIPQGRTANNYTLQDTVSFTLGSHTLRGGFELFQQRGSDIAPARERGEITYTASPGFSIFGNFIDDFGGNNGVTARDFGNFVNYPKYTRQAYFFQDRWRATQSLTLTMGVRYEYFGTPMNALPYAAFSGLFNVDPRTGEGPYRQPSKVNSDTNNWAPVFGVAYSPNAGSGMLGWLLGERKTVIRGGYSIGYESFFNNILSNAATSTPNIIATSVPFPITAATPRGQPNISTLLPTTARTPLPGDAQTLVPKNLVNPYLQRWSFGIQRELPKGFLADISYVGSKGTKLFVNEDLNPVVPPSLRIAPAVPPTAPIILTTRLDALQGGRLTRTNGGDSNYNSLQTLLTRRFGRNLGMSVSYTWSKLIDNASEVFGTAGTNSPQNTALPSIYGGLRQDRAVGAADRTHRTVLTWSYSLPWMRNQQNVVGRVLGGWQVSGLSTFESGNPLNVYNGVDADGIGGNFDRPDFNPSGRAGVRALPVSLAPTGTTSPTGYVNPDASYAPIDPNEARYIGIRSFTGTVPLRTGNAGRNTERLPWINNWDANLQKEVRIAE
ncbi:MAG: TonB-dependent receptor, partial [Bryobacteraceae bacterium]|nr:TonB-dependent receptor [Bryobacteraceae bacterium]